MQSEKKAKQLTIIIAELTEIRESRESKTLRIAELLSTVNSEKMYKDVYVTFAGFCEFVGYSRGYAYDLIKIHGNDKVRNAFSEIGALNARTIARAKLDDSTVENLVAYAKEHKTPRVKEAVKAAIDAKKPTPVVETNPLKIALAKQTVLLKRRNTYKSMLEVVIEQLAVLDKEIAKLSK